MLLRDTYPWNITDYILSIITIFHHKVVVTLIIKEKVSQPASQRGLVIRYICNNNSRMWGWGTSLGGGKSSNRGSKATYGQWSGSQRSFGCRWKFWNLLVKEDFKTVLQMPFSLRNDWETQEKHTLRSNECL